MRGLYDNFYIRLEMSGWSHHQTCLYCTTARHSHPRCNSFPLCKHRMRSRPSFLASDPQDTCCTRAVAPAMRRYPQNTVSASLLPRPHKSLP